MLFRAVVEKSAAQSISIDREELAEIVGTVFDKKMQSSFKKYFDEAIEMIPDDEKEEHTAYPTEKSIGEIRDNKGQPIRENKDRNSRTTSGEEDGFAKKGPQMPHTPSAQAAYFSKHGEELDMGLIKEAFDMCAKTKGWYPIKKDVPGLTYQ